MFFVDSDEGASLHRKLGWTLRGTPLTRSIAARGLIGDGFTLAELTAQPTVYRLRSTANLDSQVHVYIVRRGSGTVEVDGTRRTFTGGHFLVLTRAMAVKFVFEEETELAHVLTAWSRLSDPQVHAVPLGRPLTGSAAFLDLLNKLHTSILDADVRWGDRGVVYLRRSIEAALEAVLASKPDDHAAADRSGLRALYRRARCEIERTYHQPATTPDSVAMSLGVTRKHLESAFRESGDTIGRRLRRTRAKHARRLLNGETDNAALMVKDAARIAGFSDVRAMKRAMQLSDRLQSER